MEQYSRENRNVYITGNGVRIDSSKMARHKASQISLFLILGLVIMFAAAMAFLIIQKKEGAIPLMDAKPVENFVNSCLSLKTKDALNRVLIQGGHYEPGSLYSNPRIYKLAKPIENSPQKKIGPTEFSFSASGIEQGVEDYLSDSFGSCIGSFSALPYPIDAGNFTFKAVSNHDSVLVNLQYPLTITSKEGSIEMNSFSHNEKVPLALFFATIDPIVGISIEKNAIPTEKIANLTRDLGLNFSIVVIESEDEVENILYMLGPMNETWRSAFVIQYDWFRIESNG